MEDTAYEYYTVTSILSFNKETQLINKGLFHVHLNNIQFRRLSLIISYCVKSPRHSHPYLSKKNTVLNKIFYVFSDPKGYTRVGGCVVSMATLISITSFTKALHYINTAIVKTCPRNGLHCKEQQRDVRTLQDYSLHTT